MVASEHNHVGGEVDLEGQQQKQHLNREATAVNVVPKEQVSRLFGVASHLKQFEHVVILTVNVADDGNRVAELDHVRLVFYVEKVVLTIQLATSSIWMNSAVPTRP